MQAIKWRRLWKILTGIWWQRFFLTSFLCMYYIKCSEKFLHSNFRFNFLEKLQMSKKGHQENENFIPSIKSRKHSFAQHFHPWKHNIEKLTELLEPYAYKLQDHYLSVKRWLELKIYQKVEAASTRNWARIKFPNVY